MAIKNAIYQVDNGADFDEIHFKTKAEQVFCKDGKTVEESLRRTRQVKVILVSRSTNINGLQIVELGFRPKFIRILAQLAGTNLKNYTSDGSYDGKDSLCLFKYGSDAIAPTFSKNQIICLHSGNTYNFATISSVSETGFSLEWTGTGTLPGGVEIQMKVEAF
ncbi:hypothetical protein [Clostridium gasigenes]|uniref:Uncharacterized protein n=1 Tax=Clostridium gasigenes TaxID=94869 RepID=A0A1H0M8X5_9CLOT|nr:hypothetical protein [Clostridium gasigenes]SDO76807.1 hypothetical protein SAMN04488529_101365 [Clostridium gasigenes]